MDPRVTELHCIMPIANVASVMERGILSHELAAKLRRKPAALPIAANRRAHAHVPGGRKLHQYANLYFDARNPLLLGLNDDAESLCVLCVSVNALDISGVVLSDGNADSDFVRFLAPEQWPLLRLDEIFAADWRRPDDRIAQLRHEELKCAEVLAPECVEPDFVLGAYVVSARAEALLRKTGFTKWITVDPGLFVPSVAGPR